MASQQPDRIRSPNPVLSGISRLASRSLEEQGNGWSDLWDTGDDHFWDRGELSAALIEILEQRQDLFRPVVDGRRKKVL
ncbi:hypothetical protein ASPZODRAFT_12549 [Penicilliopsis zonata CBS 506.65]|uniref:Uncharacterized protein n=1 Tax=Penicilliopsis zonata CBS 506.65 TaxID=1073090 RepID=A0A1L9SX47_9EURO|nr:hypothetical protein ASPZODRAFT_12549 [Penicilliopsis zonata CBS 506.65]OJJ51736.1 hypothetical protein ASPZODRAFT_12549 [Penicilliopsis zonata CBS 506.65]